MSETILSHLLSQVPSLGVAVRSQVRQFVADGQAQQALDLLGAGGTAFEGQSRIWGVLQVTERSHMLR